MWLPRSNESQTYDPINEQFQEQFELSTRAVTGQQ